MTKRRIIIIAAVLVTVLTIGIIANANGETPKNNVKQTKNNDSAQKTDVETTVTAPEGAQPVGNEKTGVTSSSPTNTQVVQPKSAAPTPQPSKFECPAGSYRIGGSDSQPVCKSEPTGCPYGDSIPVDSPKCAPPESEKL